MNAPFYQYQLMQTIHKIYDLPIQINSDSLINRGDICQNWTDAAFLKVLIGASTHASAQQYFAVIDGSGHQSMAALRRRVIAVVGAVGRMCVLLAGNVRVPRLWSHLLLNDLPIFNRDDQIKWGTPEMLMDQFTIFSDGSYLHIRSPVCLKIFCSKL
jgi:hypothetical protein